MRSIERKIKVALALKKMSIEVLAAKAGITKATIHNIFNKNDSKLSHLQKIAHILDMPVSFFYEDLPPSEAKVLSITHSMPNSLGNEPKEFSETNHLQQIRKVLKLEAALDKCSLERKSLEKELALKDELLAAKDDLIQKLKG